MSGAASIRARFEEDKSRAASSNDDQRGGKKTKSNVEHCADDEVLRMLVRDHLSHKSSTQIFMESKGFVMLFKKIPRINSHGAGHGSVVTMQSLNLQRKCARTDLLRFHIQKAQKGSTR